MSDDMQFVFTAVDQVTPALQSMQRALSQLDTSLGGTNKALTALESGIGKSSAKFQQSVGGLKSNASALESVNAAVKTTTASLAAMQNAQGKFEYSKATTAQVTQYRALQNELTGLTQKQQLLTESQNKMDATNHALKIRDVQNALASQRAEMEKSSSAAQRFGALLQNVPPNSTRYALYDVSNSLTVLGAALIAGQVAAVGFAASYERAFADVSRTVNDLDPQGLENLEGALLQLSNTTPMAFEELAHIASLGGQLGISGDGIEEFTETVAKLGTVTNLSVDAASNALGRFKALLNVAEEDFDRLGSAIVAVGVNSVATESQIVNVSVQISSMAGYAGYTADQVIGLSGALASIGVPPELARGTITRIFSKIGDAVADGGLQLDEFSRVAGVSATQFASTWGTPEFSNTFAKFMKGLSEEGGNAINVLHNLGITSVRDVPLLLRLANAADASGQKAALLSQTLSDAKQGWEQNTALNQQYGKITDTTVEKLKILGNQFKNLFAIVGAQILPAFKSVIDIFGQVVLAAQWIADLPVVGTLVGIAVAATALIGVVALLTAGLARAGGAVLGMQTAALGLVGSFTASRTAILEMNGALATTPGFMARAGVAARGLGAAVGAALGPIGLLITALTFGPEIADGFDSVIKGVQGIDDSTKQLKSRFLEAQYFATDLFGKSSVESMKTWSVQAVEVSRAFSGVAGRGWEDIRKLDESIADSVKSGNVTQAAKDYQQLRTEWMDKGGSAKTFAAAFVDTTAALRAYKPEAESATEATRLIGEDAEIGADRIQKLSDALASGAASFLNTGDLIKQNQQEQQDAATATADANNKASEDSNDSWQNYYDGQKINLEAYLRSLQDQVSAQETWKQNIDTLQKRGVGAAIIEDLSKLGQAGAPLVQALAASTDAELGTYVELWRQGGADSAQAFANGAATNEFIIQNALKNVGVAGQASLVEALKSGMPIEQVMAQFNLDAAGNPIKVQADARDAYDSTNRYMQWVQMQRTTLSIAVQASLYGDPTAINALRSGNFKDANGRPLNVGLGYASGGYTGDGGKYQAAGLVHKGEFVMDAASTSRIGVPQLYDLMRGKSSAKSFGTGNRGFAVGGAVGGSGSDAGSFAMLVRAVITGMQAANITLVADGTEVASTAGRGAATLARQGKG